MLKEIFIEIKDLNPVELLGIQNSKLKIIKRYFNDITITSRGKKPKLNLSKLKKDLKKDNISLRLNK